MSKLNATTRQVAGLLAAGGEHEVVAVSRRPGPPTASSPGVSVAVANYADPAGVGHIVALSGLDADPGSPFCYALTYGYTEQMLHDSGCAVSIARASLFTEFFLGFLARARASGEIRRHRAGAVVVLRVRDHVQLGARAALGPGERRGRQADRPAAAALR
ncbi:MAG TPA: hypothetical protein VGM53_29435 [Streptosporangiaceae bacterium]